MVVADNNSIENERRTARVETDLVNIKELLLDIKDELKGFNQTYVPRTELNEMFRSRDKEIREIREDKQSSKQMIVAWAAVVVSVIAVIFSYIHK